LPLLKFNTLWNGTIQEERLVLPRLSHPRSVP
jgi:hypothetical protein